MPDLTAEVGPQDHSVGPEDAPVTMVEYGDFECEHCGAAFPVIRRVRGAMGDSLRFVFRQFPLTQSHPHAELAAEASEAAAAQGRFWEMHDLLFEHQDALDRESLVRYAEEIGLDVQLFADSLRNQTYRQEVHEDFLSGVHSGVNGTPTFYINGDRFEGYVDLPGLLEAIRIALNLGAPLHRGTWGHQEQRKS
jgi:formate-nitrite transporter family protein